MAHHSEYRANNHALSLDGVPDAHRVEPYPCPFCWNWHVGRIMKPGRTRYLARTRQSKTPHDSQEEQAT